MVTEIEAKFTDINPDEIRKKLTSLGAVCVYPERLMRRKVYEHPTQKDCDWFRVRDEGDKITMGYKQMKDRTLHGTKEIEFVVPDFDEACAFLEATRIRFVSYQETKREKWKLNNTEITIDTWPWIPSFVELESLTETEIKTVAGQLGFFWKKALFGSVENVYVKEYDVTEEEVCDWPEITFISVPEWLQSKKKSV